MSASPLNPVKSERGVALVIVLLLLAVMSGLATGMSLNSHVEIQMASNEVHYAGARAAAEAGMNRAIRAIVDNTTNNLLLGQDNAAGTADDGDIGFLMADFAGWPEALGASGQYSYQIEIFDDDDTTIFPDLEEAQWLNMEEQGDALVDLNERLILRATGFGPKGTIVRVSRTLHSDGTLTPSPLPPPEPFNPAILVDGNLTISGNPEVTGANGSVHANGNLSLSGSPHIEISSTASGDFSSNGNAYAGLRHGGNAPSVEVPAVNASDYMQYATHLLGADGKVRLKSTNAIVAGTGWTYSAGSQTWSISGNNAPVGTFYVTGNATVSGNRGSNSNPLKFSIIATGSITVTGNSTIRPENVAALQFVTEKDLVLAGNLDADQSSVEGQSFVREQLNISGNPDLRGQIIVKNAATTNGSPAASNTISGNPLFTYDGFFDGFIPDAIIPPPVTTYLNNVFGWLES